MKALVAVLLAIIVVLMLIIAQQGELRPQTGGSVAVEPVQPKPAPSTAKSDCSHGDDVFDCVKYIKNYDADTITFDIPNVHSLIGKGISVRVRHIDTPEMKGKLPCEKEAAVTAKKLVEKILKNGKRIRLTNVDKDKYFRILADVEIDGRDLKEELLKSRLAYIYEGGTKEETNWCERLPASR